jgi:monoamine oxidase
VLEARDRVGGRTYNAPLGGSKVVEQGGEFVGPTQDHIAALLDALGIKTFFTHTAGDDMYYSNGSRTRYNSATAPSGLPPDLLADVDLVKLVLQLDQMALEVPVEAPWTSPHAGEWDGQTFETWKLANTITPSGRALVDTAIENLFGANSRDLSLLFALFRIHAAGSASTPGTIERLISTRGGGQERRIVGGSQVVALELAKRLGRRIALNEPAVAIDQTETLLRIRTDRRTVSARQVIVAIPPSLTAQIDYPPILPARRAQLLQRLPQGSAISVQLVYDTPFWRGQGLSGMVIGDANPVKVAFDNSPPDGTPGVLGGYISGGTQSRIWSGQPLAERRAAVIGSYVRYFGQAAASPRAYLERDWSAERWTRGCAFAYAPPGALLDYGEAIRAPVGRIHWAGTETATYWNGYMDGAVSSGQRAALETLAAMGRPSAR